VKESRGKQEWEEERGKVQYTQVLDSRILKPSDG
jgi:hypothetical protein